MAIVSASSLGGDDENSAAVGGQLRQGSTSGTVVGSFGSASSSGGSPTGTVLGVGAVKVQLLKNTDYKLGMNIGNPFQSSFGSGAISFMIFEVRRV